MDKSVENKPLTMKQEAFVQNLIKKKSQRESYKGAYNCQNMADKTIDEKASRLFAQDKIKARYQELLSRLEDETIASAKEVLQTLSKALRSDITSFTTFGEIEVPVTVAGEPLVVDGRPLMTKQGYVSVRDSSEVDGTMISEIKQTRDGIAIKLHDKLKAAEMLAKHHGMFVERHEHTGPGGGPMEIAQLTPEERQARIDDLIKRREGGKT